MKHILSILAAVCVLAAPAAAQTIRTLGFNTTNGEVVAATNVVWTNSFNFSTNAVSAQVRTNLSLGWSALTNTNATNFRTAIGLGTNDQPVFDGAVITGDLFAGALEVAAGSNSAAVTSEGIEFTGVSAPTTRANLGFSTNLNTLWTATNSSNARSAVGLGLAALTNTSNVTAMRALSGSTNASHPFSGSFVFVDDASNTWSATVSNGIIQFIVEQ